MNLVIDYGNSTGKVGIFEEDKLREKLVFSKSVELESFIKNYSGKNIIISSVNTDVEMIAGWANHFSNCFILSTSLPLPVTNRYSTSKTLGVDRLAAVCGARQLYPGENCLVIDAGTCITYDFIDRDGNYFGGGISPGLKMRFQAMHTFTARLPLTGPVDNPPLVGDSTITCMQSGVVYGMTDEIDGIIRRYFDKFAELKVILCGGDTPFFENKLKASIFASPELVLSGLNSILLYNVNH